MQNNQENIYRLSNNLKFLIACCQTGRSVDDAAFIEKHIVVLDQQELISLSIRHGILPLVYKTIKEISIQDGTSVPHDFLIELKAQYMGISQRNMLMSAELIRIMKLFEEYSIEALAFKGPALSQMAYGDITLRQYVDLDILVDETDAYKAGKLMSENGHTAILPLKILQNNTCLHTAKDFSLISHGSVHTELHWRLFAKKHAISIMSCSTDKKCQKVYINNQALMTLQNELLLVYLCLHGAKHAFERIEWICDIDRLIRNTKVHWEESITIAERSNSKRSFYLGLSLAHNLFHTLLPDEILNKILLDDIIQLQEMTLKQLVKGETERSDFQNNKETFLYQSKLFDNKSDMIRFYFSTFFNISTQDCQTFILPEQLKFLYIILRPIRLLLSYIQRGSTTDH